MGFHTNSVQATREDGFFRKELFTTDRTQVGVPEHAPGPSPRIKAEAEEAEAAEHGHARQGT